MIALLIIAAAMLITDVLGTLLVVAESSGRAWQAGVLDALGDVSRMVYTALGVDAVLAGSSGRAVATMAVVCASSFVATSMTTAWARRWKEQHK